MIQPSITLRPGQPGPYFVLLSSYLRCKGILAPKVQTKNDLSCLIRLSIWLEQIMFAIWKSSKIDENWWKLNNFFAASVMTWLWCRCATTPSSPTEPSRSGQGSSPEGASSVQIIFRLWGNNFDKLTYLEFHYRNQRVLLHWLSKTLIFKNIGYYKQRPAIRPTLKKNT